VDVCNDSPHLQPLTRIIQRVAEPDIAPLQIVLGSAQ